MLGERLEHEESSHAGSLGLCDIGLLLFQEQMGDTGGFKWKRRHGFYISPN